MFYSVIPTLRVVLYSLISTYILKYLWMEGCVHFIAKPYVLAFLSHMHTPIEGNVNMNLMLPCHQVAIWPRGIMMT